MECDKKYGLGSIKIHGGTKIYKLETYLGPDRLPVMEKHLVSEKKLQVNSPGKVFEMLNRYFRL